MQSIMYKAQAGKAMHQTGALVPPAMQTMQCEVVVRCDPARMDRVRPAIFLTANSAQLDFLIFSTWDEFLFCGCLVSQSWRRGARG